MGSCSQTLALRIMKGVQQTHLPFIRRLTANQRFKSVICPMPMSVLLDFFSHPDVSYLGAMKGI